ncbi:MAG: hypothetical protein ACLFQ8_02710 [Candidatus Aenigmatarchaeota archaeon]
MKTWDEAYETIEEFDEVLGDHGKEIQGYLVGGIAFRYLLEKTKGEGEVHKYRETDDVDIATNDILPVFELAEEYNFSAGRSGARLPRDKISEARVPNPGKPETFIDLITDYPFMDDLEKEKELTVDFNEDFPEIENLDLNVPNPDQLIRAKKKAYNDTVTRSEKSREQDLDDAKLLNNYRHEIFEILKEEDKIPKDYESKNFWPEIQDESNVGSYMEQRELKSR